NSAHQVGTIGALDKIRPIPTNCFYEEPVVERTSRTSANPARRFLCCRFPSDSRKQCRFYFFLDLELRYSYYRDEMLRLYTQVQEQRMEMQVQEYTYRARIRELELEGNDKAVIGECYEKVVSVFIVVVFVMYFIIN
ncbi:hypothetical protein Tco_1133955, partial [Tanacetum coccineum]